LSSPSEEEEEEEEVENDVSIIASGVLCFLFLKALKI